eukprot:CAMPEP_0185035624 /NCGR_PEP_ID=MMETSP1103-20130426/27329_1 /TAXON_ID=36769 /ORGANISM="Paraphysomonas bandaiensis, Strain Caron Lab Isolate" /LENGTH=355 /DNA_ID=CAMNT_0027572793 /DNA_START=338 /DNA_END=1405 /DNA_ORIENTATION=-
MLPDEKYDIQAIENFLQKFRYFNHSQIKNFLKKPTADKSTVPTDDPTSDITAINRSITAQIELIEKYRLSLMKQIAIRDELVEKVKQSRSNEYARECAREGNHFPYPVQPALSVPHIAPALQPSAVSAVPPFQLPPQHYESVQQMPPREVFQSPYPDPHGNGYTNAVPYMESIGSGVPVTGLHQQQRGMLDIHSVPSEQLPHGSAVSHRQMTKSRPHTQRSSELTMLSAMRKHMSMHRELLQFNSQYAGQPVVHESSSRHVAEASNCGSGGALHRGVPDKAEYNLQRTGDDSEKIHSLLASNSQHSTEGVPQSYHAIVNSNEDSSGSLPVISGGAMSHPVPTDDEIDASLFDFLY